jgi:3-hydroxyacyl-CoA dehydrogenase/enoyl-CoA hydratase/3-hydroxybutyryl-CoA epimerase
MMGSGIAYVTASAGIACVIKDVSIERAQKAKDYSRKLVEKAVGRGHMTEAAGAALLAAIQPTADAKDVEGCDMLIEAVFENRELKANVTREAEQHAAANVLTCSNTSTLPISGLAQASKQPKNFIGLHFFSPVDKMPLVEIIVGKETSDQALAHAFDFAQKIKKTPIVVNDSRGFYTSRVFGTFVNEGVSMLAEGWNPASIEQAAAQNGSPVGPLAVNDEVSLELSRAVREQSRRDLAAEGKTVEPTPVDLLIDRMVLELGRKGKAAGAGFYEYPKEGKKQLWSGLSQHFVKPERKTPSDAEFAEMKDRLLYITAIESIRCLEEKVVRSVSEANIGSIMGIGAPPWTGGTLQYVNYVGTRAFAARAAELAVQHGARFAPPKLLLTMAERNERFE